MTTCARTCTCTCITHLISESRFIKTAGGKLTSLTGGKLIQGINFGHLGEAASLEERFGHLGYDISWSSVGVRYTVVVHKHVI